MANLTKKQWWVIYNQTPPALKDAQIQLWKEEARSYEEKDASIYTKAEDAYGVAFDAWYKKTHG